MKRRKLVLIQFSRALVPLMVMFFHVSLTMNDFFGFNFLGLASLPMSGGVNYFFALSGFMIYYIYKDRLGQPKEMKPYLLNRFIRIYPLYWVLSLALLPVLFLIPWYGMGHETDPDILFASLLLIPNPRELEPVLVVAWSLVHTVFFYVMFSVLFLGKSIAYKGILIGWTVLTFLYSYGFMPGDHYLLNFLFNQVNLIFIAGILCAYVVTRVQIHVAVSVGLIAAGLAGFPFMWYNSLHPVTVLNFDEGTGLASVLLILGLASFDGQKSVRIPSVLNSLGNAAFAIYLSHVIILDALAEVLELFAIPDVIGVWAATGLLLTAMIAGGCAVHQYIEKPLQRKVKQLLVKAPTRVEPVSDVLVKEKIKID